MGFFRKHKKAVSPVIAVMLLVAVAVAAVGAYFIWFRSFQAGQQEAVRDATGDVIGPQLQISGTNDEGTVYLTIRNNYPHPIIVSTSGGITPGTTRIIAESNATITDGNSYTYYVTGLGPRARGEQIVFVINYNATGSNFTSTYRYNVESRMPGP